MVSMPWSAREREGTGALLLVGTQTGDESKGIYAYRFADATGELHEIGLATKADNPTFLVLAPDGRTVFATSEVDQYQGKASGAVSSFVLDRRRGRLKKINEVASLGGGPCHLVVDREGRSVFAANYGGGSVASFAVRAGGRLSPAVSFLQYSGHGPDAERQEAPHAHRVTVSPDNRFLLVNDLGLDAIHLCELDATTAKLKPRDTPAWRSAAGAGPRALLFHPSGRWAYCVTEMQSTVEVLRWNAAAGTLDTVQEMELRPPGFQGKTGGCDIVLDREGRFAYAADRFDDIVVSFAVSSEDGRLTLLDRIDCGGKIPRHLALDPSGRWLLVANQDSDTISILSRDARSGVLKNLGYSVPLSKPQCLVFA
jgi:6-phosphogluconolactonase